jgi:hypothetical protein
MADQLSGEQLIINENTLVFYVDEFGDEQLNNQQHPIFAFGGVATVSEHHIPIAHAWRKMKAATFPQVVGPLHAKKHIRDRLSKKKRRELLAGMAHRQLARFGTVITSGTVVPLDKVVLVACGTLANRFANVAEGMIQLDLWQAPGRVVAVFEHSTRLAQQIEQNFPDAIKVGEQSIPLEGCFMDKLVADPFLEMADFVASTIGRNIKYQLERSPTECTDNFKSLFREVGPPLASYIEVTAAL